MEVEDAEEGKVTTQVRARGVGQDRVSDWRRRGHASRAAGECRARPATATPPSPAPSVVLPIASLPAHVMHELAVAATCVSLCACCVRVHVAMYARASARGHVCMRVCVRVCACERAGEHVLRAADALHNSGGNDLGWSASGFLVSCSLAQLSFGRAARTAPHSTAPRNTAPHRTAPRSTAMLRTCVCARVCARECAWMRARA